MAGRVLRYVRKGKDGEVMACQPVLCRTEGAEVPFCCRDWKVRSLPVVLYEKHFFGWGLCLSYLTCRIIWPCAASVSVSPCNPFPN